MSSGSRSSSSDTERSAAPAQMENTLSAQIEESLSESDRDSPSDDSDAEIEAGGDVHDAGEEDTQALSHAEKRRQKKKQQNSRTEPPADATTSKRSQVKNTADLPPSKFPKRQNSVWVGNLSFKTTPESLRGFFDGVGEITRIHMPMKLASSGPGGKGAVKENRGFAYVDFALPDSKAVAITLSENHLDGRRLLIKDGDDYTGRPSTSSRPGGDAEPTEAKPFGLSKTAQKILRSQKQPAGPTLFFGNLGFETTEQSLLDMVNGHRKEGDDDTSGDRPNVKQNWIRKVRMGTFEDSGKCKGWAFMDFTSTEHATEALTNPRNYSLDGRKLVVEYASPEAVRRGGGGLRGQKGGNEKTVRESKDEAASAGQRRERVRPVRKRKADEADDGAEGETSPKSQKTYKSDDAPSRRRTRYNDGESKPFKSRAKPGAALAMAKRETASIVPSQGKKIVF